MSREMVGLRERIPLPDFLAFLSILTVQHIRELLKISYDDDVFGTGKGEDTSGQILSLIHISFAAGLLEVLK